MSLKPKRVNFDSIWSQLLETVKKVVVGEQVERTDWNDRFSYLFANSVVFR